jgi:hypothetical protein
VLLAGLHLLIWHSGMHFISESLIPYLKFITVRIHRTVTLSLFPSKIMTQCFNHSLTIKAITLRLQVRAALDRNTGIDNNVRMLSWMSDSRAWIDAHSFLNLSRFMNQWPQAQ